MSIKFILPFIASAILSGSALAQTPSPYADYASRPEIVSAGSKLAPRSAVTPYPSREEALSGASESAFVIPVTEWETENITGGTRYNTRFKKNFSWDNRSVILRLEDVASSFQVFVNDSPAGYSQAGMGRTEFDITKLTKPDYNTVSVTVFSDAAAKRIEQGHRDKTSSIGKTYIVSQPTVRIHDVFTKTSTENNTAFVKIDVVSESILLNPKEYIISYELIDPAGKTVSNFKRELHTKKHSRDTTSFVAKVENHHKWNHETPNLYTLLITSRNDNRVAENIAFRIGLRDISYTSDSIMVDGIPVNLHTARYSANANSELTAAELRQLKTQGYNTIITDLRPQPDYFYSLCDIIGLYVCCEADIDTGTAAAAKDNPGNSLVWLPAYTDRATTAYYSSHTHPSVIMYSPARNSANGYSMYEAYTALKKADNSVPILYFGVDGQWNSDLSTAVLCPTPDVKNASADNKNIAATFDSQRNTISLRNNCNLTQINGTYKVTVKKGRKKVALYTDTFEMERLSTMEIAVPEAAEIKGKGSIDVEIQTIKQGINSDNISELSSGNNLNNKIGVILGDKLSYKLGVETQKVTIEDIYDITKETLPL